MCSCQLWNRKDMNIQNVFLLVMEQKGYEHLECVLASYGKYMNIQDMKQKGYEHLECVLASYGIERI